MSAAATVEKSKYVVTASRQVDAPAQQLFDLVADPAMHPRIDGGGSVKAARDGAPARLSLGATFVMDMKIKAKYKITNTVVEFEEGRRIAWRHFNGHVWRWTFEPLPGGGTQVTEQWDARPAKTRFFLGLLRFADGAATGIPRSLDNLAGLAAQG